MCAVITTKCLVICETYIDVCPYRFHGKPTVVFLRCFSHQAIGKSEGLCLGLISCMYYTPNESQIKYQASLHGAVVARITAADMAGVRLQAKALGMLR